MNLETIISNLGCITFCDPIEEKRIDFIKKQIKFKLPQYYLDLMRLSNGCEIGKNHFSYFDLDMESLTDSCLGGFLSLMPDEYTDFYETFLKPPELFPRNIIAFAEVGNGDLICFDYRSDPKTDNPPVVYWNHEAEVGKDISFIAKDFEEFLSMLKEPED